MEAVVILLGSAVSRTATVGQSHRKAAYPIAMPKLCVALTLSGDFRNVDWTSAVLTMAGVEYDTALRFQS